MDVDSSTRSSSLFASPAAAAAALEDLANDEGTLAPLEEAVAEGIAADFEVPLESHDVVDQFDLFVGQRRASHGDNSTGKKGPLSSENGPDWLRR